VNGTWDAAARAYLLSHKQLPVFVGSGWGLDDGRSPLGDAQTLLPGEIARCIHASACSWQHAGQLSANGHALQADLLFTGLEFAGSGVRSLAVAKLSELRTQQPHGLRGLQRIGVLHVQVPCTLSKLLGIPTTHHEARNALCFLACLQPLSNLPDTSQQPWSTSAHVGRCSKDPSCCLQCQQPGSACVAPPLRCHVGCPSFCHQ
jgi:hypothetical protein